MVAYTKEKPVFGIKKPEFFTYPLDFRSVCWETDLVYV